MEQRFLFLFPCEVVEVVEMRADFDPVWLFYLAFLGFSLVLQIPREEFGSQPRPVSV